ncbi:MAG TPA: hypothetical protein VIS76_03105 [Pseudomonadales bacterium]
MTRERNSPSAVILDMLRSARSRRRTARSLISAGALFGFSANTMRVNLSRLMARGLIESPERGLYQLTSQTDAVNEFVERWRLGEQRVRPWQANCWLFAHAPADTQSNGWALDALGFRAVRPGLHARPDNLAMSMGQLRSLAAGIGLAPDVLLMSGRPEDGSEAACWPALWQPDALNREYQDACRRLAASARALPGLPADEAQLECFSLGGEMIHLLAKDPLLPLEMVDTGARQRLWRAMLDYDVQGKQIWASGKDDSLRRMPRPQLQQAHHRAGGNP